jgi:drug/metabolite transporter (DMT)-like permease
VDRPRAFGIALVLVSACAFGSGALFAKPVYAAGVDWHVLSSWRFLFGALLAWAWLLVVPGGRAGLRRLAPRAIAVSLGLGVLYTGNSGTYYAGLETVPASLAALIVYVYPALVAVLSLRFGRRLEGRRAWLALGLALIGVVLSVGGIPSGTAPPATGLVLIIASPVIYAFWIILAARLSGERRDKTVTRQTTATDPGAEAAAATALIMTATAVAWWISALAVGRDVLPWDVPGAAWPGLFGVGAVATFVAIQAFYAGAQRIGAANAALVSTIEPIWTISLAALLFAEHLAPVQLVGGALIIGGVVLAQTGPIARRRPQPAVRLADE